MSHMFDGAFAFNQDIHKWKINVNDVDINRMLTQSNLIDNADYQPEFIGENYGGAKKTRRAGKKRPSHKRLRKDKRKGTRKAKRGAKRTRRR
jgi:hypothetical protein